jgi:integrase
VPKAHDHLTVHGLRRTMNNLLRQVTHGEVVRSVTGHVTERMTEHYSHIGADEKSSAVAKVLQLVRPTAASPIGKVELQVELETKIEGLKR